MFCANCGSKLAGDVRFCAQCGAPVSTVAAMPGTDDPAVRAALGAGDKLGAIRALRAATGIGLAEAKAAVEAMAPELVDTVPPLGLGMTAGPGEEVRALLERGDKIAAIKAYREATGLGLKDAKDAVERFAAGLPPGTVPAKTTRSGGLSCLGCLLALVVAAAVLLALFQIPIRMSGSYPQAIAMARDNSRVRDALGEPIAVFPIVWTGKLTYGSDGWTAAYDVRLSGPKASGWLKVRAMTRDGFQQTSWRQFSRVEARVGEQRIEIPLP